MHLEHQPSHHQPSKHGQKRHERHPALACGVDEGRSRSSGTTITITITSGTTTVRWRGISTRRRRDRPVGGHEREIGARETGGVESVEHDGAVTEEGSDAGFGGSVEVHVTISHIR